MTTLALAERQADVLQALRSLEGRATVGDVAAATGLGAADAEGALKALLESHRGHVAVSDSGELLYRFDRRLIRRGSEPLLARLKSSAWTLFSRVFKAGIVVMLVGYFVVFVALVLAAIFAGERGGGRRGGWGGRRGRGGLDLGNMMLWYWLWSPRWRLGRPYYGHRWARTLPKEDRPPFYRKVFAFVFGADRPRPTRQQLDRSTLRLIRARRGVLGAAELVEHTGIPLHQAEEEMGRLVGAYDGEPVPSPRGELAYAFPSLMMSAHGRVREREPDPAWMRLEYPLEVTGNDAGSNALVAGMNGFILAASATAPWFIFPRLGLGGPAAFVALVVVPVLYSLTFFAVPALRALGVARENRRRERRNVRRVVLGLVYAEALGRGGPVTVDGLHEQVAARFGGRMVPRAEVEAVLNGLAAEFDAEVAPDADGRLLFHFPAIRRQFEAAEAVRRSAALEGRALGDIVYDTGDTAAEADARERAAFDRALEDADLAGYVPSPDRVAYEADHEVVALEEELRGRGIARA